MTVRRRLAVARIGWGVLLVVAPHFVVAALGLDSSLPSATSARTLCRVLGVRHLAQGVVTAAVPVSSVLRVGVALDGLHAASMVVYASGTEDRRRALVAAGTAWSWAALGCWAAWSPSPPHAVRSLV